MSAFYTKFLFPGGAGGGLVEIDPDPVVQVDYLGSRRSGTRMRDVLQSEAWPSWLPGFTRRTAQSNQLAYVYPEGLQKTLLVAFAYERGDVAFERPTQPGWWLPYGSSPTLALWFNPDGSNTNLDNWHNSQARITSIDSSTFQVSAADTLNADFIVRVHQAT